MIPIVRSITRIDNVVRLLTIVILSPLILSLMPGPAEARSPVISIEGKFLPADVEPGERSSLQINLSSRRFSTPVTVQVGIVDSRGRTVDSHQWSDVRLPPNGKARQMASNFEVPSSADPGSEYRASVVVYYGAIVVASDSSVATLAVDGSSPSTATPEPTTAPTTAPTATPEPTPTAPPVQPPAESKSILRVNAGGQAYVDSRGMDWAADDGYSGGQSWNTGARISQTTDDPLYASYRAGSFRYDFAVPNGNYELRLLFAETSFLRLGENEFDVLVNGVTVLEDFDILDETRRYTPLDKVFPVAITNGAMQIAVESAFLENGKLSGFELLQLDVDVAPTPEPSPSATATPAPPNPTPEPSPTSTPSPGPSPTPTATSTPTATTIQGMIDAASPNSTVRVPAGTYREKIYINKPIILIADSGVVIDGEGRDRWIVGQADNVTIQGFTFVNSNQPQYHGGLSNDSHNNWTIRGNTFRDAGNAAIDIKQGSGHLIENNLVVRSGNVGIRIESVGGATIRGNTTEGNNTKNHDPGWEAGGMKITGNYGGVRNVVIENNEAHNNNGPGIWVDIDGDNIEIRNNRVHHNARAGIIYELSFRGRIHGNVVYNNGSGFDDWGFGAGILIQNSSSTEVFNNVVAWNRDGITIISQNRGQPRWSNVTGNSIHDNSIIGEHDGGWNTYGLAWLEDWNGVIDDPGSNNRGYNNEFWFSTPEGSELRFRWADEAYWTVDDFSSTPGGQGSRYLSNSQKNQVLSNSGI